MTPFQPKGEQARWRTLYEMLAKREVGDIVTYAEMAEALELEGPGARQTVQLAMRRAAKELEVVDKHATDVVPNIGYRIVETQEHLALAKRQQRRAGRALARGHSKVVNVDLSNVEPDVRAAFQVVAQAFSMQMDMNRRFESDHRRTREAITRIVGQQERSAAEVAELRQRLEQLEAQQKSATEEPQAD